MPCQLKYKDVVTAHASGTLTEEVGALRNGNAPSKFESKTKIATLPTTGTYRSQWCPAFSCSTSVMPNPSGFVSSNSATCCEAPGRSTDKRERTHKAKIVPTSRTSRPITTCSGIGSSAFVGRIDQPATTPTPPAPHSSLPPLAT